MLSWFGCHIASQTDRTNTCQKVSREKLRPSIRLLARLARSHTRTPPNLAERALSLPLPPPPDLESLTHWPFQSHRLPTPCYFRHLCSPSSSSTRCIPSTAHPLQCYLPYNTQNTQRRAHIALHVNNPARYPVLHVHSLTRQPHPDASLPMSRRLVLSCHPARSPCLPTLDSTADRQTDRQTERGFVASHTPSPSSTAQRTRTSVRSHSRPSYPPSAHVRHSADSDAESRQRAEADS
ncbi:hypothetical protein BDW22DRAFT_417411 [Trametopsis cervina]|nr:hypothetical protein BDW22DRAFT_417411 [Trametopsis cervina]